MCATEPYSTSVDLISLEQSILQYIRALPPQVLGVASVEPVQILLLTPGAYNLNYHVQVGEKRIIFRININPQSGLANQIEYEFNIMKFLEVHDIAPVAYHMDSSKRFFPYDIMIEEYLEGPYISLTIEDMPQVAELLFRIHSLPVKDLPLIVWNDPLVDTYNLVLGDLEEYESKITPDPFITDLAHKCLQIAKPKILEKRSLFAPEGMNHTDDALDNFIKTCNGLRMIDWEKPRFDDCTYDVCCFLARPAQLWCAPATLSPEGREKFLQVYFSLRGGDEQVFREKVRVRQPLVSLHWVMWGAIKLCDLRDQLTSSELQKTHEEKVVRWERMTQPHVLQEIYHELRSS